MSQITVAAFDFDHTLTDRDSLLAFLFYQAGCWKSSWYLVQLFPYFIQFFLGLIGRQEIKEKILTRFFKGLEGYSLQKWGQAYAEKQLDSYLKPQAIKRLQWHQAQGHECILISAAPDFYLHPWAERHGFKKVLSSHLELDKQGCVTGRLQGVNCWGPEKVRRLLTYLGSKDSYELYAYGDSRGDQELLALADHPFYRCF